MALPAKFDTVINSLYNQIIGHPEVNVVYDKFTLGGKTYKIRVYRGTDTDGFKFRVDIIER